MTAWLILALVSLAIYYIWPWTDIVLVEDRAEERKEQFAIQAIDLKLEQQWKDDKSPVDIRKAFLYNCTLIVQLSIPQRESNCCFSPSVVVP